MSDAIRFTSSAAWHKTGLYVEITPHNGGVCLSVSDLNPEMEIKHCARRLEIFALGLWIAAKAIFSRA